MKTAKVIILAGGCTFGNCPLSSRLPRSLWPILDKPALQNLIDNLSCQGIKKFAICSNGDTDLLKHSITAPQNTEVTFLAEHMPLGTAGSIRRVGDIEYTPLLIVLHASIISPPNLAPLIASHYENKCDMTIVLDKNNETDDPAAATVEAYICQPSVLDHIPTKGYYDIKESLIPALITSGKTITAAPMNSPTGHFRNWQEYLSAMSDYLQNAKPHHIGLPVNDTNNDSNIWKSPTASIHPSARIFGPVVIMDNTLISEGSIILGPAVIGRNVRIDANSLVEGSVIWNNTRIDKNCEIQNSLIDSDMHIKSHTAIQQKLTAFKGRPEFEGFKLALSDVPETKLSKLASSAHTLKTRIKNAVDAVTHLPADKIAICLTMPFILIAFLWAYLPEISNIRTMWQRSDVYSTGMIVPFLAIYLAWTRRHDLAKCDIKPCLWGIAVFAAGQAIRYIGLISLLASLQRFSMIISIAGLILLTMGWKFLRKTATLLLFLALMFPWPHSLHSSVTIPMQNIATSSAAFCLETTGISVIKEGNILMINNSAIAIAEACNGLRMASAFLIISSLLAMLTKRSWLEKIIIIASSIPISIICNTIRLTAIVAFFTNSGTDKWQNIFHDFGGLAMMPMAIAIVILELWTLKHLRKTSPETVTNKNYHTNIDPMKGL